MQSVDSRRNGVAVTAVGEPLSAGTAAGSLPSAQPASARPSRTTAEAVRSMPLARGSRAKRACGVGVPSHRALRRARGLPGELEELVGLGPQLVARPVEPGAL